MSVVSNDSTVSTLATTVSAMQKSVAALTKMTVATERAVAEMCTHFMAGADNGVESDSESNFMDSDTHDDEGNRRVPKQKGNRHNDVLMRQGGGEPRTKKLRSK